MLEPQPKRRISSRPPLVLAARAATAVLAAGLGAAALSQWRVEQVLRAELAATWRGSGAASRHASAADRARRDPDPLAGQAALARTLFADALQPGDPAALPAAEAAAEARRVARRLDRAQEHAAATLARRPASWEAALVLGGGRLLAAASTGGDDLYSRPERWRAPLRHARRLAPGAAEPGRLLAIGTLASWHALSEAERAQGRALLARELRDPTTLRQLLPAWAAAAASPRELVSVLPAEARSFELLEGVERAQGDWTGVCAARALWRHHLDRELEARLALAERRLAGGDAAGARREVLAAIADAPLERRFAPRVVRALASLPAGPVTPQQGATLAAWLRWALRLWTLGQNPLPPTAIDRLAGLASDLGPEELALAALAAGHLDQAELWERRADRLWSEAWAPYAAAKASALLARGELDAAAATLAEVHPSYRRRWAYLRSAARLETRRDAPPAVPGSHEWPAVAWRYEGGEAFLEAVAAAPASSVTMAVDLAPASGSAVELTWDGAVVGCSPAAAGAVVRAEVEVTPGPHLLAVRDLAAERIAPGAVALAPPGAPPPATN